MVNRILWVVAAGALVGAPVARADDAAASQAMQQAMEEQAPVARASESLPDVNETAGANNESGDKGQSGQQGEHQDGPSGEHGQSGEVGQHGEVGENAGTAELGEQHAGEHGRSGQSGANEDGSH